MVDTNEFFFEDLQVAVSKIELAASSKLLVEAANDLYGAAIWARKKARDIKIEFRDPAEDEEFQEPYMEALRRRRLFLEFAQKDLQIEQE